MDIYLTIVPSKSKLHGKEELLSKRPFMAKKRLEEDQRDNKKYGRIQIRSRSKNLVVKLTNVISSLLVRLTAQSQA